MRNVGGGGNIVFGGGGDVGEAVLSRLGFCCWVLGDGCGGTDILTGCGGKRVFGS